MIYFFRKYPPDVAVYGADHFYTSLLMDGRVIMLRVTNPGRSPVGINR